MSSFHTLEVVGRGSETQLQVCENLIIQVKPVGIGYIKHFWVQHPEFAGVTSLERRHNFTYPVYETWFTLHRIKYNIPMV